MTSRAVNRYSWSSVHCKSFCVALRSRRVCRDSIFVNSDTLLRLSKVVVGTCSQVHQVNEVHSTPTGCSQRIMLELFSKTQGSHSRHRRWLRMFHVWDTKICWSSQTGVVENARYNCSMLWCQHVKVWTTAVLSSRPVTYVRAPLCSSTHLRLNSTQTSLDTCTRCVFLTVNVTTSFGYWKCWRWSGGRWCCCTCVIDAGPQDRQSWAQSTWHTRHVSHDRPDSTTHVPPRIHTWTPSHMSCVLVCQSVFVCATSTVTKWVGWVDDEEGAFRLCFWIWRGK